MKKHKLWIGLGAIIIIIFVVLGLLNKPKEEDTNTIARDDLTTVEDYGEKFIGDIIEMYSPKPGESGGFEIVESKIIKLEKLASFEDILDSPVEIWAIEFRLKPKDLDKVIIAGGMNVIDGWVTEEGSMGKPLLLFTYEDDLPLNLGTIYSGEMDMNSLASQESGIRVMLENDNRISNVTYEGDHVLIKFPMSTGETAQSFLSQPIIKGEKGIWVVERWMDGNGTIYHEFPQTDMRTRDFYEKEQREFDQGEKEYLGDPLEVAYDFIINKLGQAPRGRRDLEVKYSATIEDFLVTPTSHYVGYIMGFSEDQTWVNFDNVEYLGTGDEDRMEELGINPNTLDNGYYIFNPSTFPNSLKLTERTEYSFINWETVQNKKTTKEKFIQYIEEQNYQPLFHLYTRDGSVTKILEQYLP